MIIISIGPEDQAWISKALAVAIDAEQKCKVALGDFPAPATRADIDINITNWKRIADRLNY